MTLNISILAKLFFICESLCCYLKNVCYKKLITVYVNKYIKFMENFCLFYIFGCIAFMGIHYFIQIKKPIHLGFTKQFHYNKIKNSRKNHSQLGLVKDWSWNLYTSN